MSRALPSLHDAKAQARQLRRELAAQGVVLGHAQALERVAHRHGFRDWNTLHAAIARRAGTGWAPGRRVSGAYLGHAFRARVVAVAELMPGWHRLELELDQAVDVVTSAHFSAFRKRVRGVVGPRGHSVERTSDGTPHLRIDPQGETGGDGQAGQGPQGGPRPEGGTGPARWRAKRASAMKRCRHGGDPAPGVRNGVAGMSQTGQTAGPP